MSTPPEIAVKKKRGPDGSGTRQRLIAAALDLFGRKGFDGVGAREIAAQATAPLASIPYHFGTKDALYRAVLHDVAEGLASAFKTPVIAAMAALEGTPLDARNAISTLKGALVEIIAADERFEIWAKLLLREHMDPSAAFDIVYDGSAKGVVELLARLIAKSEGRSDPESNDLIIRAFAAMGEVLVFRITQSAIKRRLDWDSFGIDEGAKVRDALRWL
jgi:TetR/AcrR family transcriptional regulator, regulator of cefoperazone and chloramphenicol sensitivity